jgi:hypothetical protein
LEYISGRKCWNFNFKNGGWNSVFAVTKEEALESACDSYNNKGNSFTYQVLESDGTTGTRIGTNEPRRVDESTLRVATPADTAMLLSSFY